MKEFFPNQVKQTESDRFPCLTVICQIQDLADNLEGQFMFLAVDKSTEIIDINFTYSFKSQQ